MKEYQYISISKLLLIYIIAFLPTWLMLVRKNTYLNKKSFVKKNCLFILIEIVIFSLIYLFPKNVASLLSNEINIQNYMIYSLKILFIASSTTVIHYSIPFYFLSQKRSFGIWLSSLKIIYIPIMFLAYTFFNTKGALFAVPFCDIFYDIFLLYLYKKNTLTNINIF